MASAQRVTTAAATVVTSRKREVLSLYKRLLKVADCVQTDTAKTKFEAKIRFE